MTDPLHDGLLVLDGGDGGPLGQGGHGEGRRGNPQVAGNLRMRNRVAHAQTRQALRLGESTQDDDIRVVTVDIQAVQRGLFPLWNGGGRAELEVGLVDDHGNGSRHLRKEGANLALGHGGTGRVIGGAHQNQAGAVGDGRSHSVQVVRAVGQVGNLHAAGAHDAN